MSRWIGLTGPMGAGKDYAATIIQNYDAKFQRCSFADSLKQEVARVYGLSDPDILYRKPMPDEVRRLLQWYGTDYRRAQDPDYWVKRTEERAISLSSSGFTPVFTDVRFPNEADMIKRWDGILVRLTVTSVTQFQRLGYTPAEHESETAMSEYDVDFVIPSDRDNGLYQRQVAEVVAEASYRSDLLEEIRESLDGRG